MHEVLGTLRDMSFMGSSRERRQKEVEEVRETGMSVQRGFERWDSRDFNK
jgi:hypothetical protein